MRLQDKIFTFNQVWLASRLGSHLALDPLGDPGRGGHPTRVFGRWEFVYPDTFAQDAHGHVAMRQAGTVATKQPSSSFSITALSSLSM